MKSVKAHISSGPRIQQGDIYKDVEYVEYAKESHGNLEISKIRFPSVIILTQDCDLSQDHRVRWSRTVCSNEDKKILSVLVAPLYNEDHLFEGTHLKHLSMRMQEIKKNKTPGQDLIKNNNSRYHYLSFGPEVDLVNSVIDFKHYFSVNVEYLKTTRKQLFVCRLAPLYREAVVQRFASFLSRIGLPD